MSESWFRPLAEDPTVPTMPKVRIDQARDPAPLPSVGVQYDRHGRLTPDPEDVQEIEDQILKMAFGKAMQTVKRRTLIMVFLIGFGVGFLACGVAMILLLTVAGAGAN